MADPNASGSSAVPRCAPLCGAVRAYGKKALEPAWWLKHERQCPMREHLRTLHREKLSWTPGDPGSASEEDVEEQRHIWESRCPALLELADRRLAIIGALFGVLNDHPELTGEVISALAGLAEA